MVERPQVAQAFLPVRFLHSPGNEHSQEWLCYQGVQTGDMVDRLDRGHS